MNRFSQKARPFSPGRSSNLRTPFKSQCLGSRLSPIQKLQREIGNQAVQRLVNAENTRAKLLQREEVAAQQQSGIQWQNISRLANGMVVRVEVRSGGDIEQNTHEYPVDVNGNIKMPPLGLVRASGSSTAQLADRIQAALISRGFIRSPTVNVTLARKIVAYGALITYPSVHLRLLGPDGRVESGSGEYPVRDDGTINLSHVGAVSARNRRLDVVESEIESRIRERFIVNGFAYLTRQHLD